MNKDALHFEALGYAPFRMKPVHFAAGFFLSVAGGRYDLEILNKTGVIKHNTGLRGDYTHENLLALLKHEERLEDSVSETELKQLRVQLNGVIANDDAVYGSFKPYKKPPGVAYSLVSDRFLFDEDPLDGMSGHFLHQILLASAAGKRVVDFTLDCLKNHSSPLEQLLTPLLDVGEVKEDWQNSYAERFGILKGKDLKRLSTLMEKQTEALATLCQNLEKDISHQTRLRYLVIALCSWLFIYLQKIAANAHGQSSDQLLLFMDFLGDSDGRIRALSRRSFAQQRQLFFESYDVLRKQGAISGTDQEFEEIAGTKGRFKFLEQHFSDLAIRIGFAQPRAHQARRKHFELQPDTVRVLLMSVIDPKQPVVTIEQLSTVLRETWGVCYGGCDDDPALLRENGYEGLDDDDDIEPNCEAFIGLLKRLNLATEPSDGLVLCATTPEELL